MSPPPSPSPPGPPCHHPLRYYDRVTAAEERVRAEAEEEGEEADADDLLLARLDAGLYTLQVSPRESAAVQGDTSHILAFYPCAKDPVIGSTG
jgi:hypothetical protein